MTVVSIDPGTSKCGVAVWSDDRDLIACWAIVAPSGARYQMAHHRLALIDERLTANMEALGLTVGAENVTVVVEHLRGHDVRPAAALESLIVQLRQWARQRGWAYVEYSPSQWRQVIATKGAGTLTKDDVLFWMGVMYPALRPVADIPGGVDAIEAAAMGLYHLDRQRVGLAPAGGRIVHASIGRAP